MSTCTDCRYYANGYCHALPPRDQLVQLDTERPHDDEYFKYPQTLPTDTECIYFKRGP